MLLYKRSISITNVLWSYTWKIFMIILSLLCLGEGYFLYTSLNNANFLSNYQFAEYSLVENELPMYPWSLRFEEYLAISHFKELFLLALFLTTLLLISVSFRQKSVAPTEYTFLRLPVSKFAWFLVNVIYVLSVLTILVGTQFIMVLISYQMYLHYVPEEAIMNQGLFLSFVRWDFLKYLFPITDPLRVIMNFSVMINASILITYLNMCITFKHKNFLAVIISFITYFSYFNEQTITSTIIIIILLVITSLIMLRTFRSMVNNLGGDGIDGK